MLTALIDIVWLGLLWLVCSLPVLTLGAASTALYYAMVKSVRHDQRRCQGIKQLHRTPASGLGSGRF